MATRTLDSPPSILPLYARAAAPMIPGASLLPFVPGGGGEIPELELDLDGVRAEPEAVAAYARVCGFALRDHLPPTYPHVLAFPLHMAVMADGGFPFGAVGLVHLENRIVQQRAGSGSARSSRCGSARRRSQPHPQGPDLRPRHRGPGRRGGRLGERQHDAAPRQRRPASGRSRSGDRTPRRSPTTFARRPRRVGARRRPRPPLRRPSPATATRSTCTR